MSDVSGYSSALVCLTLDMFLLAVFPVLPDPIACISRRTSSPGPLLATQEIRRRWFVYLSEPLPPVKIITFSDVLPLYYVTWDNRRKDS